MTGEQTRLRRAICDILDLANQCDRISFRAVCSILNDHGFVVGQEVLTSRVWSLISKEPQSDASDASDVRSADTKEAGRE